MDLKVRLAGIKRKVLKRIEQAAASRNTRLVSSLSALALRAEEDEELLAKIENRVDLYESEIGSAEPQDLGSILELIREESRVTRISKSRGRGDSGEIARQHFVEAGKERGYSLVHTAGVAYRTTGGKTVAIPFATERQKNRWFLGYSIERPDIVVLLCQREAGSILEFILPASFYSEFWKDLSPSKGQVKFNISQTGPDYWIVVPKGHGRKRLNEYLGAYGYLKK